jgi:endo-1,4-beta-xylanase
MGMGKQWFAIEPSQGIFNYSMGEQVSNIAKANRQVLRCHNLVWHSQLAPWGTVPLPTFLSFWNWYKD